MVRLPAMRTTAGVPDALASHEREERSARVSTSRGMVSPAVVRWLRYHIQWRQVGEPGCPAFIPMSARVGISGMPGMPYPTPRCDRSKCMWQWVVGRPHVNVDWVMEGCAKS